MEQVDFNVYKNRMLILFSVVLMTFMACLDGSIVNVALPVMAGKLAASMESISWVVTSYLIVIAATILIFGRLGDILGKTEVFKYGVIFFTLASLMCGLANSLPLLIIARVIQGVGGAAAMATNQGIIAQVFPSNERGRALGIAGAAVALGTLVGPPLGGFMVDAFSWHFIFLINVPIGIFTFILGMKVLPRSHRLDEKMDLKGAVLFFLGILALFGSLLTGEAIGYTQPVIILGFAIAVIALILFLWVEQRIPIPLLDLKIFKNRLFSLSLFCGFVSFMAIHCPLIIQPFYFQHVLKLSPAVTGLFMAIMPLILMVVAPASGALSDKIGSEFLTFLGLLLTSMGLFLMSTLNEHSSGLIIAIFIAISAIGNGLFQSPNTSLIMSTVPKSKLGVAGSVNALLRNLGMVTGITLSTIILYNRMSKFLGYRVTDYIPGRDDAFVYGMRCVFITAGCICIIGATLTAFRLFRKKRSAEQLAAGMNDAYQNIEQVR
jgi:EmrB/QacA subfamily drug resistance transporter